MLNVGDYVTKVNVGVCLVAEVVELKRDIYAKPEQYYLLTPEADPRAKIYLPYGSAPTGIRPTLSCEAGLALMAAFHELPILDYPEDKRREMLYKEILGSGEPERMAALIRTLRGKKAARLAHGKTLPAVDDRYLRQTENLLYAELTFATGKTREEILLCWE